MLNTSKGTNFTATARSAVIGIAVVLGALTASAQTAKDVKGATPLVAIQNEPPAKLVVDLPIPEQLALGRVFIQYRTENLRILPVFGKAALEVSPRVGHLHYFLDDQSWPTVDTSGETVVLVGLRQAPTKCALNWRMRFIDRSQIAARWWSSRFPLRSRSNCEREGAAPDARRQNHQRVGAHFALRKKADQYVDLNDRSH